MAQRAFIAEDKSYWTQYSSVELGKYTLHINSGNEDWALFKNGQFVVEGYDLQVGDLTSNGVDISTAKSLVEEYRDFLC